VSTESIATEADTQPHSLGGSGSGAGTCASCGAPMADDQRYCLHCGERRVTTSSFLASGHPSNAFGQAPPAAPTAFAQATEPPGGRPFNITAVIAGVGVLLLAMGVGVLIGRSGNTPKQVAVAAPASTASATTPAAAASNEPSFSDDWPSGTSGYTVQLQALPLSSTKVGAVQAAKAAASAKGAKNVGALRSEDFSSLKAGSYIIYSGVYHTKAEAQKALPGLKKLFAGARVVSVSGSGGGKGSGREAAESATSGGSNIEKPAPPSVVEHLHSSKGQSYEQKSKNLPNVISTG
jgi:hypothetical protein